MVVLSALLLVWPFSGTSGAEREPVLRELWVPTSRLGPVLKQMPEAVMLERAEFERLQRSAGVGWLREGGGAFEEALLLRSAEGRLHLQGEHVRLDLELSFESLTEDWNAVVLGMSPDQLLSVQVSGLGANGEPSDEVQATLVRGPASEVEAEAKDGELLLLARGRGVGLVRVQMWLPVQQHRKNRYFDVPPCPAPQGVLRMDGAVDAVLPTQYEVEGEAIVASWEWDRLSHWRLLDPVEPQLADAPSTARLGLEVTFSPGQVEHILDVTFTRVLQPLPETVRLTLPQGARNVDVSGDAVRGWELDGQVLAVRFPKLSRDQQRRHLTWRLSYLKTLDSADEDGLIEHELSLPELEGFDVVHGESSITVMEGLNLLDADVDNMRRWDGSSWLREQTARRMLEEPDADDDGIRWLSSVSFESQPTPLKFTLRQDRQRIAADLDTRIQLTRDDLTLTRTLQVRPLEGDLLFSEILLPQGEELVAAEMADSEADWRLEDNRLIMRWPGGVSVGGSGEVVITTRRLPDAWTELGQEPLALEFESAGVPGVERLAGYLALDYDSSMDVLVTGETGLERRDSATSPIEGRLAWFRLDDCQLRLEVTRRAAELSARVIQHAVPLAGSLEIEGGLELEIRHSGLRTLEVDVEPEFAPLLRWSAPVISEERLDPETGRWTLTFREELAGRHMLRWRMSVAHPVLENDEDQRARFSNRLPVMTVPSARRFEGHVVLEANTDTEVSFKAVGLEPFDTLGVPELTGYRARHRAVAAYRYRGEQWRLELTGVRHNTQPLSTLVIRDLSLLSVLGLDEPQRHQLTADVLASGEQFVDFGLPTEARVLSLVVDGLPTRPVAGEGGMVRVELPPSQDGEVRSRILLAWEQPQGKRSWGKIGLVPPALPAGAVLLASDWQVHVPDGFTYRNFKGNLRPEFEPHRVGFVRILGEVLEILDPFKFNRVVARAGRPQSVSEVGYLMEQAAEAEDMDPDSLHLETRYYPMPSSTLEGLLGGPADTRQATIQDWFAVQGVVFGEGSWARYNPSIGRIEVRNTPQQLELVERILAARGDPFDPSVPVPAEPSVDDPFFAPAPSAPPVVALKVDRAGVDTLAFELPTTGRVFRFSGHEAPGELTFEGRSWESQMRWAWVMVVAGILLFYRFARKRPLLGGVFGLVLLGFVPVIVFGVAGWAWFNAILLGWMAAMGVALFLRVAGWIVRVVAGESRPGAVAAAARILIAGAVMQGAVGVADAQADEAAAADAVRVVIPYDPAEGMDVSADRPVYLDRATFERLWKAAHAGESDELLSGPQALPQGIDVAATAFYEIELEEERLLLRARIEMVSSEPWTRVPLSFVESPLKTLTLNGEAAGLTDGGVLIEHAGLHVLEFSTESRLERGWRSVRVPLAAGSSTGLSVVVGDDWSDGLELAGEQPLLQQPREAGGRSWTGALGAVDEVTLQRTPARQDVAERAIAGVDVRQTLEFSEDGVACNGWVSYHFPGGRQSRFAFEFDNSWRLHSLPIRGMRSLAMTEGDDGTVRVEFELAEPVENEFDMSFYIKPREPYVLSAEQSQVELSSPNVRVGSVRMKRMAWILEGSGVRVSAKDASESGWRRVVTDKQVPEFRTVAAFEADAGAGVLTLDVKWQPLERKVKQELVYQIGRTQLETIAVLDVEQAEGDIVSVAIELAPGQMVQDVQGESLSGWFRSGDRLLLNFAPGTRGKLPVLVYLSQPREQGELVSLRPLEIRGWPLTGGRLRVVAHAAVGVTFESEDGAGRVEEAGDDVDKTSAPAIIAPFEHKRSFEFGENGFGLVAELQQITPQIEASWTQVVEARDGYADMRALIQLNVRRGAMDSVRLRLPQGLPLAEITGPLVREVRRVNSDEDEQDDQEHEILEVTFQRDVLDDTRIELALELPYVTDSGQSTSRHLDLPLPEMEVEMTGDRFLLVAYQTQDEVRVEAPGGRNIPVTEAPFLPIDFKGDRMLAFAPGPARARLGIEELTTTAGREAVVTLAELNSAVRENGDVWTTATYKLLNRSLQFLPVELPRGAVLISVRVDGVGVRADRGESKDGDLVLIPLIQTDPGQVAYPVELTYRQSLGGRLGNSARAELQDPRLPGISIQRTLWNVWLPDDYRVTDRDGNMEPVAEDVTVRERLSAAVSELARLNQVVEKGSGYGYSTRIKALQTAAELKAQIEHDKASLARPGKRIYGKGDQDGDVTVDKLEQDLQQITVELSENRIALVDEIKQVDSAGMRAWMGLGWRDDGSQPWHGWIYNDARLQEIDRRRYRQREDLRNSLTSQILITDNLAIPMGRLQAQLMPTELGRDPITKGLRFGSEAIQSTFNARGQMAQQQAAFDPPGIPGAQTPQRLMDAEQDARRQMLDVTPVEAFERADGVADLARQYLAQGRRDEARRLLESALGARPDHPEAARLLLEMDDPERHSPALSEEQVGRVDDIRRNLELSRAEHELGNFDASDALANKVLAIDPYNAAARRQMTANEQARKSYFDASRDHSREHMLRQVDELWETRLPGLDPDLESSIAQRELRRGEGGLQAGRVPGGVSAGSLRGTGKVSLEIDFPRTRNSVHYRKNHDHARLVLELRRDTESPRLQALIGLFVGLLGWGVLVGVARRWPRGR